MTASALLTAVRDAVAAALPTWTVIDGAAHDLGDHQVDIGMGEARIGGSPAVGGYQLLEEVLVRFSLSTGTDLEATYRELHDARDTAIKAIADANPFGPSTEIDWDRGITAEAAVAAESTLGKEYWTALVRVPVRRLI